MIIFKREGSVVKILVDTKLTTGKPVYPMCFDCGNENYAELILLRFQKMFDQFIEAEHEYFYKQGWEDKLKKRRKRNWRG